MKKETRKNQKGFTLIEILATILIVCLVLGISGNYVMNIIHNSKDKSNVLALNNIKKTANTYVNEFPDDVVWNKTINDQSITYSCVSIDTLVNKGYLTKNDIDQEGITKYIVVTKNAAQSIVNEEFDQLGNDSVCQGNVLIHKKVTLPTEKKFCNNIFYTKKEQILTKSPSDDSFTFSNNKGTDAGSYKVKATLKEGYVWKDDTTSEKYINCSIKKATPELEIKKISNNNQEPSQGESGLDLSDTTLSIKSTTSGTLSLKTSNQEVATAFLKDGNTISENTEKTITIKKFTSKKANTYITIYLTPTDTKNYKKAEIVYTIGEVKNKTVDKPTCNNIIYNGSFQNLVTPNNAYLLYNNVKIDIGSYQVIARLKYGFQWTSGDFKDVELTCKINETKVKVIYNPDGGEPCNPTYKTVTYLKEYGPLCTTTNKGYQFQGWYKNEDKVEENTIVKEYQEHKLIAKWLANQYQIILNPNGGNLSSNYKEPIPISYNSNYSLDNYYATKPGNDFVGWYTTTDESGSKITGVKKWNYTSNQTFYAHWTVKKYNINYDNNGGSGCSKKENIAYGSKYGTLCTPTNSGLIFSGWYTAKTGGSKVTSNTTMGNKNVTIYARWTANGEWFFCREGSTCHNSTTNTSLIYCEKTTESSLSDPSSVTIIGYAYSSSGGLYYKDQNGRFIWHGCLRKTKKAAQATNDCVSTCV